MIGRYSPTTIGHAKVVDYKGVVAATVLGEGSRKVSDRTSKGELLRHDNLPATFEKRERNCRAACQCLEMLEFWEEGPHHTHTRASMRCKCNPFPPAKLASTFLHLPVFWEPPSLSFFHGPVLLLVLNNSARAVAPELYYQINVNAAWENKLQCQALPSGFVTLTGRDPRQTTP